MPESVPHSGTRGLQTQGARMRIWGEWPRVSPGVTKFAERRIDRIAHPRRGSSIVLQVPAQSRGGQKGHGPE